jgi:23S rRNA (guanosine2251-2'-O)-methyltransferase
MSPAKRTRPKVSNAKAAKKNRPKAARAAARPSPGPGRGRSGANSARGQNRKAAPAPVTAPTRETRGGGDHDRRPRPKAPRGLGGDQVEGRQAVREMLLAGTRKIYEVWVAVDQDESVVLDDIAELALSVGVNVRDVSRAKLAGQARTESPQGVLALAAELPETDLDDLARPVEGVAPFLLAVDGVTDPGNLGALLRTAETAGVNGVVLPRHRAVHVTPTVTKAAAGAIEYLPMALVGGLPAAILRLQGLGVRVIGLDGSGDSLLFDVNLGDDPVMLVLGAEGKGLSRLVRQRCDEVVAIPLGGRLGSLNVAAAGALACFEVTRRRQASA